MSEDTAIYGAENIKVLEGLDGVRRRPGMYIGDTGENGLHHLVWEILDNAVDEALAGYCTKIDVALNKDGSVTISDNGRGIPTDMHAKGVPAIDVVFTVLHAGGKFDEASYKFAGGLHGVGASVVNALSKWVKATVAHGDGYVWKREYRDSEPYGELERRKSNSPKSGTKITFLPDGDVFGSHEISAEKIIKRVSEVVCLLPGLKATITDERPGRESKRALYNPNGIVDLIYASAPAPKKNGGQDASAASQDVFITSRRNIFRSHFDGEGFKADFAFAYADSYKETILSFANLIPTGGGGAHVTGFRGALTKALNNAARKQGLLKEKTPNITGAELAEGLVAVVSVYLKDPQFEGQTKDKLGDGDAEAKTQSAAYDALSKYFAANPKEVKAIVGKALVARKAREKAKAAADLVRRGGKSGLSERLESPSKLASCTSKDPERCELFLVEGDSAGGSAKQARDRAFQAVLPLRGKILNCHKVDIKRIAANAEIKTMIRLLGCGTKESYDASKLRYNKVVCLTDADVDGSHIACLLITFFYSLIPKLLEDGHVYIARPPLYQLRREGRPPEYFFSDEELRAKMDGLRSRRGKEPKYRIQRYKGLGEMNPTQLWETAMDPAGRTLKRVTVRDWERAGKSIDLLMGDMVGPRREWIMENGARFAGRLDV